MLALHVFGTLEITGPTGGGALRAPMQRRLLGALIVRRDTLCNALDLCDVLWPSRPPPSALKVLHTYIGAVRRALPEEVVIETIGQSYRLVADWPEVLDVARFEALITRTRDAVDAETIADLLGEAIALRRGPAYGEFADEPFAVAEAARVEQLYRASVTRRLDVLLALGRHDEGLADAQALAELHGEDEHLVASVMIALYRDGRQGDALRLYDVTRRMLRDEFGVEPSSELQQRFTQVLRHAAELDIRGDHDGGGAGKAAARRA